MKRIEIRVCVMRTGGTNCDTETKRSFDELGTRPEIIHANQLSKKGNLMQYDALVLPGGFSQGDYVRAGAMWARWLLAKMGKELRKFADDGRPILGICNGFQVLVEAGLLPGFKGASPYPEASLAGNSPPGYNCRWIHLKHENHGKCVFTQEIPSGEVLRIPIAHSEGRFVFNKEKENKLLERLYDNDQLVFRYCSKTGDYAEGEFPTNPNGSFHDIAGICDSQGTIFGLMPHPERAFYWWQQPDWTRDRPRTGFGDGKRILECIVSYIEKR